MAAVVAARGLAETISQAREGTNPLPSPTRGDATSRAIEASRAVRQTELEALRDILSSLPPTITNRVLDLVLQASKRNPDQEVSALALARLFFHQNIYRLDLNSFSTPQVLLAKLVDCTSLTHLDLASQTTLNDYTLSKTLAGLRNLEFINLRGCTKISSLTVVALAKSTGPRLKTVNLSLTGCTTKGLAELFGRCKNLERLKLANVAGLVSHPFRISYIAEC